MSSSRFLSTGELTSIVLGGALCVPMLMLGHGLSHHGFYGGLLSILLGNALLLCLGLVAVHMGVTRRLPTVDNAALVFGPLCRPFFGLLLGMSMLAWFGLQLNLMTESILPVLAPLGIHTSPLSITLLLGLLLTLCAISGIRSVTKIAKLAGPLLVGTLLYAAYSYSGELHIASSSFSPLFIPNAVSLVMSAGIVFIVDIPTFYRHAPDLSVARKAITLSFALVVPGILICGLLLGLACPHLSIVDILLGEGTTIQRLFLASFLLLAGWTTNNGNLYSAATCLKSVTQVKSRLSCTIFCGVLGTIAACLHIHQYFEVILGGIGVCIGSLGSVILTSYLFHQNSSRSLSPIGALGSAFLGISVGILGLSLEVGVSGIPLVDAFTFSALSTALCVFCSQKEEQICTV